MSKSKPVYLAWNAGKDAYAGNRLVAEHGPMQAVNLMSSEYSQQIHQAFVQQNLHRSASQTNQ